MKRNGKILSLVAATALFATVSVSAKEIMEPTGLDQIKEIVQTDARLIKRLNRVEGSLENIDKVQPSIDAMNALIKEAIKARGLVNDGVLSVADTKEINLYLVENHLSEWYELRGENSALDSTGYYLVNRKELRGEDTILNTNAINAWGQIYNPGFEAYDRNNNRKQHKVMDYAGNKGRTFETVGYYLSSIMQNDIASGTLYNPNFQEVRGTTGTKLDMIVNVILNDEGLLRRVSTRDLRTGAEAADAMNHLIVEAIVAQGLGNDATLSTADIRQINHYLVENYKVKWAELHGDDEAGEETGYHRVQNDGAYTRMFADNVMNSIADGIYHLGFYTNNKNRLLNEDGNKNKSFEKVAWWLDTSLKSDLTAGKFNNSAIKEVVGTTGTSLDKMIPYIYNDKGLLLKVSTEDIRVAASAANRMNELIVEAIKTTGVASDDHISKDDVKALNTYLVEYYASEWIELHGDDEAEYETGYHRIQNDGALGRMHNRNTINSLADGIYHLGFYTTNKNRLVNEDGNNNVSFSNVAYWMNKSFQTDYANGVFK